MALNVDICVMVITEFRKMGRNIFSTPRVAGAAALVKQKFPSLTSAQIKQVLLQTADDLGASGVDEIYGHGALNIMNALSPQGTVVPK